MFLLCSFARRTSWLLTTILLSASTGESPQRDRGTFRTSPSDPGALLNHHAALTWGLLLVSSDPSVLLSRACWFCLVFVHVTLVGGKESVKEFED